ncbi:MAG TPA: type VI secretion system tube protein Hcp [Nitrososphaera sp.]
MPKLDMTQIAAMAVASVLAAYVVSSSFATKNMTAEQIVEIQYADAAQVDYFLKIDGIEGESTSSSHRGEIEIESFSWGATQTGTSAGGGGGGAGKVSFSDIHFTTKLNKASPKLMLACATGEHIKDVVLVGELSGKRGQKFLEITLTDVLISSYQSSGSSGDVPTDSFSLNFAKIEFKYFPMNKDGSLGEPVTGGWDVKENKEV